MFPRRRSSAASSSPGAPAAEANAGWISSPRTAKATTSRSRAASRPPSFRLAPSGRREHRVDRVHQPVAMDAKAAHDRDYSAACAAAGKVVEQRVPAAALQEMDALLTAQAAAPVADAAASRGRLGLAVRKTHRAQDQPRTGLRGRRGRRGTAVDRVALRRYVFPR